MSDEQKLDQIIAQMEALESKINEQNKRLAIIETTLFTKSYETPKPQEPQRPAPQVKPSYTQAPKPETKIITPHSDMESTFKGLELNIGKYFFQIIGAAIFVLGMGFLFQYSIEQGLISPLVRVIAGFISATVLIIGGELSRKRTWTLALIAGGVALYYISLLAATLMYELIPLNLAFGISIAITSLAFLLGFLHDSVLIASFGLIGGFLAPIFASKPEFYRTAFHFFNPENKPFMISYLMLITGAFITLSLIKRWGLIAAGTLFFMWSYTFTPMVNGLTLNQQMLYLTAFYTAFVILPYAYACTVSIQECLLEPCMIAIGGLFSFTLFQHYLFNGIITDTINESASPLQWLFAHATYTQTAKYLLLIFGTLYLIKTIALFYKKTASQNVLSTLFVATIASFFGVILLHFEGFTLGMAIQSYALLILCIAFLLKEFYVRILGFIFLIVGFAVYLINIGFGGTPIYQSLFFNDLNGATAVLVLIFAISAYLAHNHKNQLEPEQVYLPLILELAAYNTILIWMLSPLWQYPYYITAIAFYSLIIFLIGMATSKDYLRAFAYKYCLSISLIAFVYRQGFPLLGHFLVFRETIGDYYNFNLLCATFVVTFIVYIIAAKKYGKELPDIESADLITISELLLALFVFLGAERTLSLYTEFTSFHIAAISVYYGISGLLLIFIGLILEKKYIRYFGLCISALTLWTLSFLIIGMKDTLNRVIIFIVVGLIFMLASFIYQRLSKDAS